MASNTIISGDYKGKMIWITLKGKLYIETHGGFKKLYLNTDTIEKYELIDESHKNTVSKAVAGAAIGAAIFGPLGLLAGVGEEHEDDYRVVLYFRDGKKCLAEIDESRYKALTTLFYEKYGSFPQNEPKNEVNTKQPEAPIANQDFCFCPQCGQRNSKSNKFCVACGNKINL